jgi:glutaredoxin
MKQNQTNLSCDKCEFAKALSKAINVNLALTKRLKKKKYKDLLSLNIAQLN